MNTEGLLLLTNDGELARWLELPKNNVLRRYRVRVHGRVDEKTLKGLKDGVTIDGIHYGEIDAALERQTGANAWLTVAIREGKNREVRRVMEHLGLNVNRLIRTHYGPFSLGTLPDGAAVQVNSKQLYEVLADYFKDEKQSVAAPSIKRNPSKWAKAKKPQGNKPGAKRRGKPQSERTERKAGPNTLTAPKRSGASHGKAGPRHEGSKEAGPARRRDAPNPRRGAASGRPRPIKPGTGSSASRPAKRPPHKP